MTYVLIDFDFVYIDFVGIWLIYRLLKERSSALPSSPHHHLYHKNIVK
jgi:hypothetical protein